MGSEHFRQVERVYSSRHYALNEQLDRTLEPRSPELLQQVAANYVHADSRVLDIGCRDAKYLIRLVQAHECSGVGLDPLDWHVELARAAVDEAGLSARIEITKGVMEDIGQPDDSFDFIWCRDVLVLVADLEAGLREAARVLRPDGTMLVYTNVATELLAPDEAERLSSPLGNVARNFDETVVEDAFTRAELVIATKDVIGTEWREYEEEREQPVSRNLLRLARLRRQRTKVVEDHGEELYTAAEASLHWLAYQLLGKLEPVLYLLRKRQTSRPA